MARMVNKIAAEIQGLSDAEKLRLVEAILADLDKPDPGIDHIWGKELREL